MLASIDGECREQFEKRSWYTLDHPCPKNILNRQVEIV